MVSIHLYLRSNYLFVSNFSNDFVFMSLLSSFIVHVIFCYQCVLIINHILISIFNILLYDRFRLIVCSQWVWNKKFVLPQPGFLKLNFFNILLLNILLWWLMTDMKYLISLKINTMCQLVATIKYPIITIFGCLFS